MPDFWSSIIKSSGFNKKSHQFQAAEEITFSLR
jgi:hypothetical protein